MACMSMLAKLIVLSAGRNIDDQHGCDQQLLHRTLVLQLLLSTKLHINIHVS